LAGRTLACAERERFIHGGTRAFSEHITALTSRRNRVHQNATLCSKSGMLVERDINVGFPESKREVVESTLT
jgi:hypothetical protein